MLVCQELPRGGHMVCVFLWSCQTGTPYWSQVSPVNLNLPSEEQRAGVWRREAFFLHRKGFPKYSLTSAQV